MLSSVLIGSGRPGDEFRKAHEAVAYLKRQARQFIERTSHTDGCLNRVRPSRAQFGSESRGLAQAPGKWRPVIQGHPLERVWVLPLPRDLANKPARHSSRPDRSRCALQPGPDDLMNELNSTHDPA